MPGKQRPLASRRGDLAACFIGQKQSDKDVPGCFESERWYEGLGPCESLEKGRFDRNLRDTLYLPQCLFMLPV